MNIYAGIGSRQTPAYVIDDMVHIGKLAAGGWILRSGAAQGADAAFEKGCDLQHGEKEIYLPWYNFNDHPSLLTSPSDEALQLASNIHPAYKSLPDPVKRLLARNMHQILGKDLNTPVRCVICWTPNGQLNKKQYTRQSGGTGSAIALASDWDIPVFNLFYPKHFNEAIEYILDPDKEDIMQL